jgi:hypothetical protein
VTLTGDSRGQEAAGSSQRRWVSSMERSAVGLKPGSGCDRGQCLAELFHAVSADLLGPRGFELCTDGIDCLGGVPPVGGQADGLNPGILLVLNALNVAGCLKVIDEGAH